MKSESFVTFQRFILIWGLVGSLPSAAQSYNDPQPSISSFEALFDQLKDQAQSLGKILRVEDMLQQISVQFPGLRKNTLLIHQSRSRQGASYEYPRVISFSDDARFAMSFNGDPMASGYYEIEMYEFSSQATELGNFPALESIVDPQTYISEGFHFRRLIFAPRPDYPHLKDYKTISSFPYAAPVNEKLCLACHGQNPRPNWEAYNRWPGSYFRTDHMGNGTRFRLGYNTREHAGFEKFYDRHAYRGRYAFIDDLERDYLVKDVRPLRRIRESQFTQLAGYLNYRRIAHMILQSPNYDQYRYALLAALYNCPNFDDSLPTTIRQQLKFSSQYYTDHSRDLFEASENATMLRGTEGWMGKLRYIIEGRGIKMFRWTMNFRGPQYAFVTPAGSGYGFLSTILIEFDQSLEPFRLLRVVSDDDYGVTLKYLQPWQGRFQKMTETICPALQEASLKALAG